MNYLVPVTFAGTTTYYARVFDKDNGYTNYTAKVIAIASNAAPVLTGANNLPTIDEDNVSNTGALVSDLIAGNFTDSDTIHGQGIAVTATTQLHGKWQFSTDGGTTWTDFGSVSDSSATLLGATPTDRVRYLPDATDGESPTITFQAWDQTDGHTTGDTGVNVATNGGTTAYSTATATATQIVTEVNDAPIVGSLNYTVGMNGVLRIPVSDLLAASKPGPPPEYCQTLTLLGVKMGVAQVTGSVRNGDHLLHTARQWHHERRPRSEACHRNDHR
jgi:hypothetical protein